MADQYITYPLTVDARDLMQTCFDYMATQFPGWTPSEGQLDTALIEAIGSEAADIGSLASEVPKTVFRYYGAKLMGIAPIDAVAATATTTWFAVDTVGHIIPAGTQVSLLDADHNAVPFVTLTDVQILAGASSTAVGAVTLVAVVPGGDSTGIGVAGTNAQLVDILAWVDHVRQDTVSTGGLDAESDDDYLNRLSQQLMLNSPRPILPNDFAVLAQNGDPSVQRATAIDGYNPGDLSSNNQRMVAVSALTSAGAPISAGAKTNVQNYLQSLREINFVVNMLDATTTQIDVTATVTTLAGYAKTDVQARVITAIQAFLSPATWGVSPVDDPNDPVSWINTPKISYLELATAINQVPGVGLITALTFGLHGGGLSSADYTLPGVAPLPSVAAPSIITVTAT